MQSFANRYDVVIVGGGHNGLVSACYLAKAGFSVLVLERNPELGGASRSAFPFKGIEAKLSVYSYLVSLFPQRIIDDLGLRLQLQSRLTVSYTPSIHGGDFSELLLFNDGTDDNREAFLALTGDDYDYRGYLELQAMQEQLASIVWPSLLEPLASRDELRGRMDQDGQRAWRNLIEEPLGRVIEEKVSSDLVRGLVFTDAKIGVSDHPHDPSLLQNRCFLYHVIGRGTGEWRVPVGGMGTLIDELVRVAQATGKVKIATRATVRSVFPDHRLSTLIFELEGENRQVDARYILCNGSQSELARLTGEPVENVSVDEGTAFKVTRSIRR